MFREVSYSAQGNGCHVAWATLGGFERVGDITRGVDVFAFGMVVMEVRPCMMLHRWFARSLNPALGFYRKGRIQQIHNPGYCSRDDGEQTADPAGEGTRTGANRLGVGHGGPVLAPRPRSAASDDRSGPTST